MVIAAIGVVVSVLLYFAGVRRGEQMERARREHEDQQEQERRSHEADLERQRQEHERQLEGERQDKELISRVADEYVQMARSHRDSGITAATRLGLQRLGSDALVRRALNEMHIRTNIDPLSGYGRQLEDVNLEVFFRFASDNRINFHQTPFEQVFNRVRALPGAIKQT